MASTNRCRLADTVGGAAIFPSNVYFSVSFWLQRLSLLMADAR